MMYTKGVSLRYLRMCMYGFTIILNTVTFAVTLVSVNKITGNAELDFYYPFWPRLFTLWSIAMMTMHAVLGLYCDFNEDDNKNSKKLEKLRRFKSTFFSCYVWPSCCVASIMFWFFYHYDGRLIHIRLVKKVISPVVNHIGHTVPVGVVVWEALFQPKIEPASHKMNILLTLSTQVAYILVLAYTYVTAGTWIYPFYQQSYGTVYFPLIQVVTIALKVAVYYAQWPISRIFLKHDLKQT